MPNQLFVNNLVYGIQQDLGGYLGGPPAVYPGGVAMDHYRGLASSVATRLVPFYKETYQPSEFLYGSVPVRNVVLTQLFFQFPVLDVKGNNVPGPAHFGAIVRAPIPGTIVTPLVGLTNRFLPMSAFTTEEVRPKDVFKSKANWNPLLEALNNDKSALKAASPTWVGATIGNFKVSVDVGSPIGLSQLAPYKGHTILTMQRVPSSKSAMNKPLFDFKKNLEDFYTMATYVVKYAQTGEEVGQQVAMRSNAAMMDLIYRQIDGVAGAPAVTPTT